MKPRHSLKLEPPLLLYLGLNVHTLTRSKKVVMELHHLGLSVSYNRVLQVENELANSVCQDFKKKGVVCPSQLRKGLFTVAAIDNIDHNPSSNTAKFSFHGTGMFFNYVMSMYIHISIKFFPCKFRYQPVSISEYFNARNSPRETYHGSYRRIPQV